MSIDIGTVEFLEKLNQDMALQEELRAALDGVEDKTGAVMALAATKGFEIDREGFDAARVALSEAVRSSAPLEDSALEAVAGGFNPQPDPPGRIANLAQHIQFNADILLRW